MIFALNDQFAGGVLLLAGHASGAAVVAVGDGAMTMTVGLPTAGAITFDATLVTFDTTTHTFDEAG